MVMEMDFVSATILGEETFEVDDHNHEGSHFEGERCGICMDIIIDRGVLDCCQHWFCFGCIDNWATITNLCPLCQNEFQLITCVPVYDTIGNNKVDEDSFPRDDDWSIEGKSNSLSFPSYYIDENAVICLDGDGCKIRSRSATIEEDSNLDTSIACDSCDLWYHAFCVGFDPESTCEDAWLCPRCSGVDEVPKKSDLISTLNLNSQCGPGSPSSSSFAEVAFTGKVSVSVADAGETALVVSMLEGNKWSDKPSENFHAFEVDKGLELGTVNPDGNILKKETSSSGKNNVPPILDLGVNGLELSLSYDTSFSQPSNSLVLPELKTGCAADAMNEGNSSYGVKNSFPKFSNDSYARNESSESEPSIGLQLGLSVGSSSSVDHVKNNGSEGKLTMDVKLQHLSEESLSRDEKVPHDVTTEKAIKTTGAKRKEKDCSDDVLKTANGEGIDVKNEVAAIAKKIKADAEFQKSHENQANAFCEGDSEKCPIQTTISEDVKLKQSPEKEDVTSNIMSIVQGTGRKTSKGLACQSPADKSSKEKEHAAGLRMKKIMRRATEDKESSMVVQRIREEIREAVRNKSSADVSENLFDPKLLAAFRAAIAGSTTEVKKLPASALKIKKSLLQKGKVRENLTKKIYANSNGKRRRAWDRDCEVEFWKYRCARATKPEKIETLKSVLNLLRKTPQGMDLEVGSKSQATNPILSRLYLADTSVFPRKDDIKPLSALTAASNSEQNKAQIISTEKNKMPSLDDHTKKPMQVNKGSSRLDVHPVHDKGCKDKVPSSKDKIASSKVHLNKGPEGSTVTPSAGSKINSQKETGVSSDVKKIDKRKWALEVLARKKAVAGNSASNEKQEDNAVLKGNYPLLAQLPIDMRPALAPSHHNKIPVSVRQTQLYRLTELLLRKANLPEIRRTAETELAVADAVNIEKEVADKSNSKLVYLNLCSQEILHRSANGKSNRATGSDSSPLTAVSVDQSEQSTDQLATDPAVVDALKNAGLLSDTPPSSPHHKVEVPDEPAESLMQIKDKEPDNVFDMDSHPEEDIYGDFEYDLDDEDYIGATATNVSKPPAEGESRVKVVLSTLKSAKLNDVQDFEDCNRLENIEETRDSCSFLKNGADTMDSGNDKVSAPPELIHGQDDEEPSLAECEELYGPDKEPLFNKLPEEVLRKLYSPIDTEAPVENKIAQENENLASGHVENKMSDKDANKQCDPASSVYKKVEAYVKEHIRPLCKSGIISAEQYRWAVAKTTDKVMKYHSSAKNANFLIKEGEKVKKLAQQYVEATQQKEKADP